MKKSRKIIGFVYPLCIVLISIGCDNLPLGLQIEPRPVFNPEGFLAVKPNTVEANALVLQWKQVDHASSYLIHCYEENGKSDRWIETGKVEYKKIEGLQANTEYVFEIKAVNSTKRESESSNTVRQRTLLSTPKNLEVTKTSETEIALKWGAVEGADLYELYYNTVGIRDPDKQYIISKPECTITGLTSNTQYFFWIKAKNYSENFSDFSEIFKRFTLAVPPTGVTATVIPSISPSTSLSVSWSPVPGIEEYAIHRYSPTTYFTTVKGTTYQDTGLSPGMTYYYYIASINPSGESAPSSTVSATTYAAPSITVTVSPITDITVTPERIAIPKSESKIFEAPDNYTQYEWYLDGDKIGNTTRSYTLETSSMTVGVHTLTIIVETSNGEKRSGSYRITITN